MEHPAGTPQVFTEGKKLERRERKKERKTIGIPQAGGGGVEGKHSGTVRVKVQRGPQDWLCNLGGPAQNENAGPLDQTWLHISGQCQQSPKPNVGFSVCRVLCEHTGRLPQKLMLAGKLPEPSVRGRRSMSLWPHVGLIRSSLVSSCHTAVF